VSSFKPKGGKVFKTAVRGRREKEEGRKGEGGRLTSAVFAFS